MALCDALKVEDLALSAIQQLQANNLAEKVDYM
jgi:hypothetical protein